MEQPEQRMGPRRTGILSVEWLIITGGVTATTHATVWMVIPVVPKYVESLGGTGLVVGLVLSSYGLARLLMNIPAGSFCERWGRKKVMLIGALGAATFGSLSGAAPNVETLLVLRALTGAFSGLAIIACSVVVMDLSSVRNRGRALSLVHGWQVIVAIASPGLGGLLADVVDVRVAFYASGSGTAIFALWAWLRLPETKPKLLSALPASGSSGWEETRGNLRLLFGNRGFTLMCLMNFAMFFTRVGSNSSLIPLMAHDNLGWTPGQLGLLLSSVGLLNLATLYPSGALADRLGRKPIMVPAFLMVSVGLFLLPFGEGPVLFIVAFYIMHGASGFGSQAPVAYIGDVTPPHLRGLSFGVFRTVGDLAFVIAPIATTGLAQAFSFFAGFYLNAFLVLAAILLVARFAEETAGPKAVVQTGQRSEESSGSRE